MHVPGLKLSQQLGHGCKLGHKQNLAADFAQVDFARADDMNHRSRLAVGDGDHFAFGRLLIAESQLPGHQLQMEEKVLNVHQPHDMIDVDIAQRKARVGAVLNAL